MLFFSKLSIDRASCPDVINVRDFCNSLVLQTPDIDLFANKPVICLTSFNLAFLNLSKLLLVIF